MKFKIAALIIILVAVLAGGFYYIFVGLEPKKDVRLNTFSHSQINTNSQANESSKSSTNSAERQTRTTRNVAQNTANENLNQDLNQSPQDTNESDINSNQSTETAAQNATNSAQSAENQAEQSAPVAEAAQPKSLKQDYEDLLKGSKRDKSLGEPRYKVFLIGDFELGKVQKETIKDIVKTLSVRGGYAHYSLFVEKLDNGNLRLALFNEDLLNETNFAQLKGPLQLLWFKFNESSMQSVKNSFYIKEFKAQIPKDVKFRYMVLSGFTDDFGTKEYNYMLGLKRDAAIASEFMRQTAKIIFLSYGKDQPMTTQEAEEYRYKNRRVETLINSY